MFTPRFTVTEFLVKKIERPKIERAARQVDPAAGGRDHFTWESPKFCETWSLPLYHIVSRYVSR